MIEFKKKHPLEKRKSEVVRVRAKWPHHVPIVVEPFEPTHAAKLIGILERPKFLVTSDMTVLQFTHILRKKLHLKSEMAFFLFVLPARIFPPCSKTMGVLYAESRDEDGFL